MGFHLKTATPSMEISRSYFDRAGFTRVADSPTLYAGGGALIEIDAGRFARPGIVLTRTDWGAVLGELAAFGPPQPCEGGRVLAAPSGTWCYLIDGAFEPPDAAVSAPASVLGKYQGISLETLRMADSKSFWEALGFEVTAGDVEQGWITLQGEGGASISLMKAFACPHLFVNPSLTYFNSGENPEVIAEIRRREIPIAEEVTVFNDRGEVDNVVLREPGGVGFFVFND